MVYIKCCVSGCEDKTSSRHRFPNPKKDMDRLKLWLNVLQDETLSQVDPMKLYSDRRICRRHFCKDDYSVGSNRIHSNAVPTLHLSATEVPGALEVAANQATPAVDFPGKLCFVYYILYIMKSFYK